MNSRGKVVPVLAAANIPAVSATTGLGTGGGAGVSNSDFTGFGHINIFAGQGASASGSVALKYASAPPSHAISGDEQFGTLTQATVGNVLTISWLNAKLSPFCEYRIDFEWAVST